MARQKAASADAKPLEVAWLELADFAQPSLRLRERYELLHRSAKPGIAHEHPERLSEEFEPKSQYERGNYAIRRQWLMRGLVLDALRSGELLATGMMVSPKLAARRETIPSAIFRAIRELGDGLRWDDSVVEVGGTIFTDVAVSLTTAKPKRGARSKQPQVRKAVAEVMQSKPDLLDLSYKSAVQIVRGIFDSGKISYPKGGVSDATILRVLRELRAATRDSE